MNARELLAAIRRCVVDAQQSEPNDVEARAHYFIATLSGSLEKYDAVGAELVFSVITQPVSGEAR
ncbi:hypothetical protein [Janthinobacterium sp. PAMC25594]|uniref:hypothetical protein n=1 Tax=Janthinobacterium sp. PAMC25594 TaxID=2861284 RepID=UPI001C633CA3|nr:hypothetical protein [Janthinobacterium sp. PAMC25594]QYG07148.1 hypothetical protein KY494_28870 [Janthinobacterium sp. PAMC25594]